jgi:hypothetical protein
MVSFVRVGSSRLYVGAEYASDLMRARIGFIVHAGAATPPAIDPAAQLVQGVICLFPTLPEVVASRFPSAAPAALDAKAGPDARLAVFTADGELLVGDQLVRTNAEGTITNEPSIPLGYKEGAIPTGNDYWSTQFAAGGRMTAGADCIQINFPSTATNLGLALDANGTLASVPAGHHKYELSLTGADRGLLRFVVEVDAKVADGLGLGMRYFRLRPRNSATARAVAHPYPIYDIAGKMPFTAVLDLAAPYEEERVGNRMRPRTMFYPPDGPLPSHFHAVHGQPLTLARAAVDSGIGFKLTRSPKILSTTGQRKLIELDHYLAPHGNFALARADGSAPLRLALGMSNLESITIRPGEGDLLGFAPGPALVSPDAELDQNEELCKTAWTSFLTGGTQAADAMPLAIDPEGMAGYVRDHGPAMRFSASRFPRPAAAFPMVPLLGLAGSMAASSPRDRLDLERNVLARTRRKHLVSPETLAFNGPAGLAPIKAWTPQGYLVQRSGAPGDWSRITFGQTSRNVDDGQGQEFALVPQTAAARSAMANALAGNRLFLVAQLSRLRTMQFDCSMLGSLFMGGWEATLFSTDPEALMSGDAILIIKHDDRAVADLAADLAQWTARGEFVPDTAALAVQKQIHDVVSGNDDLYAPLRRRLQDPQWNGVLVLNASLLNGGLPGQLAALSANLPTLPIHHVGIDISSITGEADERKPRPAAVFGVIHYENAQAAYSSDTGLAMRVPKLILRVENDCVDLFECTVDLKFLQLFDVPVKDPHGQPTNEQPITLQGRFESRVDTAGNRHESYRFVAENAIPDLDFAPPSIIQKVQVSRVELLTMYDNGKPTGRYLVDGKITFAKIGDLDILGLEAIDFSGFGLDFDLDNFKVRFNYPSIRFDLDAFNRSTKQRRKGSFLSSFPLKLRGFQFGDLSLKKLGYFDFGGIKLPAGFKSSHDFKFGLNFDLDLGSLGALAKKLDRFKLQVIVGWKKDPDSTSLRNLFAFGFRLDLGEGAGGIDLGLQGIMRLTAETFNLKKVRAPAQSGDVIVMSAHNCVLDLFGQRLPTKASQRFSLFIFSDLGKGLFEKPGWYASFVDAEPSPPIALKRLTLGQRVNVHFDKLSNTQSAFTWLDEQEDFGKDDEEKFVAFAGSTGSPLSYDPDRDWFIAASGQLFEVADVAVLLRDPDLYGLYVGMLGEAGDATISIDLLYEKLADGVGRYAGELLLPPKLRNFEAGAVSLTLGLIRAEMYTDGGFLIDLGMPDHVDYSRSFAIQAGPFIGKGGLYIGRTPRESVPVLAGAEVGKVFRAGIALRMGLGREFQKGPIRAGLSVSVFGRLDGAIARNSGSSGYTIALLGETGVIAEIEGAVDLGIVRARLLLRLWVASGVLLVTGRPVLLYCEGGVHVSVVVVIGRIRVFGHKIEIRIRLSYHTQLRFEWVLPAQVPPVRLGYLPQLELAPAAWTLPDFTRLGVTPSPMQLRLAFDGVRVLQGGVAKGRVVPSVFWLAADTLNAGKEPLAGLGQALVAWAALLVVPGAHAADDVVLAKDPDLPGTVTIKRLQDQLRTLEQLDPAILQQVLAHLFAGSRLDVVDATTDGEAYAFPVPPGLVLEVDGKPLDFGRIGELTDAEAEQLMAHLNSQFAEITERERAALPLAAARRTLVDRLFQDWCQLLALSALDAIDHAFAERKVEATIRLGDLWSKVRWDNVAGRAGRLFHGGLRVPAGGTEFVPLYQAAGLFIEVPPDKDASARIAGVGATAWLGAGAGTLKLQGADIARLSAAPPRFRTAAAKAAATRCVARSFTLPQHARLREIDGTSRGLLCELGTDLRRELARSGTMPFPDALRFAARTPQPDGEGEFTETALSTDLVRCLVFDMVIEQIPLQGDGDEGAVRNCFQIAGTSEAERLGLDALLRPEGDQAKLSASTLSIAWKVGDEDGHARLVTATVAPEAVILARSTLSVERRPFENLKAAAPTGPDDIYRATLTPAKRRDFLLLLQRAAIVNSGGTYLIVPPALGSAIAGQFRETKRISLSFILEYAADAAPVCAAVNAVMVNKPSDVAALEGSAGTLVGARLDAAADLEKFRDSGLVESLSLRPPGTELLRVLRAAPATPDANAPLDEQIAVHLASEFDMLEFQVEDERGALLGFDACIPLGSEMAVAGEAPQQLREWLEKEVRDAGFDPDACYRYDLLLPLARLVNKDKDAGPYEGVGKRFTVRTGWRDLYGNRLGVEEHPVGVQLLYRDPLIPLESWPGVQASFYPGAPGSNSLRVMIEAAEIAHDKDGADNLRKVIQQLSGPAVGVELVTSLGVLSGKFGRREDLLVFLRAVAARLDGSSATVKPFEHTLAIPHLDEKAFLPIELRLVVTRDSSLVAPGSVPGVAELSSPIPAQRLDGAEAARAFSTAFQEAFSVPNQAPRYWVARGNTDSGDSAWWVVNAKLIPARKTAKPTALAAPPLALAALSAVVPEVPLFGAGPDGGYASNTFSKGEERLSEIRVHDCDIDELMRLFLGRIDAFLSPVNAPVTAQVSAGDATPFERVARAKAFLLGSHAADESPLLSIVQGVRASDKPDAGILLEARRSLREACASDLERYYTVGATLVQPFESAIPAGWFSDEPRPKLYGRLRFDGADTRALGFRALTRGIELREGRMELGIAVLPESEDESVNLAAHGPVVYECTHVERLVERSASNERPAPSRWLTLIPVLPGTGGRAPLPVVTVAAAGEALEVPMPMRRLPHPPQLSSPTLAPEESDGETDYDKAVDAARRWSFGFHLVAEFLQGDQFCGRLVYNGSLSDAPVKTEPSAAPVYPPLFAALVKFQARTAAYWNTIIQESGRRAAGAAAPVQDRRFDNACERFAEAVEDVLTKFTGRDALDGPADLLEDRFIITDTAQGARRRVRLSFADHLLPGDPERAPHAGDGKPRLMISQVVGQETIGPANPSPEWDKGIFEFTGAEGLLRRRKIEIGRLDAIRLQSVWAAGSIRRNAQLAGEPVQPCFVYRTPEIYLQQVAVPSVVRRHSIALRDLRPEPLGARLARALAPVFAGQLKAIPVQLRFDFESGRIPDLLAAIPQGGGPDFLPVPDPKLQIAGITIGPGGDMTVEQLAEGAAAALLQLFAMEPPALSGRIVISALLRTAEASQGQPLLHLTRLLVPLEKVTGL